MLWALVFVTVTAGFLVSQMVFMAARRGERDARHNRTELADTFARSGLQDAIGWFHSRSDQPITAFDPTNDPEADPPRSETLDPAIGLVREFEISGSLWGRYEVRHDTVADVSGERGDLVPGSVWEVGVRSYVYRRRDPAVPHDQEPNSLVGTSALRSEVRWLQITAPAPAALCADEPGSVTIGARGQVDGGGAAAIAYRDVAATDPAAVVTSATVADASTVVGVPAQLAVASYDASPQRLFTMRLDELRTFSDVLLDVDVGGSGWSWDQFLAWLRALLSGGGAGGGGSGGGAASGAPTIGDKLIVARGLQLAGDLNIENSLVVIDGDLTTTSTQKTRISGVVYVSGNATIDKGDFELDGTLIVRGQVRLGTGMLGSARVRYDAAVVDRLRRTVGKYRAQRARNPFQ